MDRSAKQRGKVAHTARPGKPKGNAVNSLIEMRDESTRAVQEAEVWEEVEMIVDSGASGTVVNENMIKAVEATNVKSDVSYKLADGSRVHHMGEKAFTAITDQGHVRQMVAAVTEVDDALLSVSKVVKAGNRVVFDEEGSYIEHKTSGEVTPLIGQRGLYKLKMWVLRDQSHPF